MTGAPGEPLLRIRRGSQSGRWGSDGWLIIEPGAVRFEIAPVQRALGGTFGRVELPKVIHARPPVVLKRARLLPPYLNTGLILEGDEGVVTVFTWGIPLSRLRDALTRAGVEVIERSTWVGIGVTEGRDGLRGTGGRAAS